MELHWLRDASETACINIAIGISTGISIEYNIEILNDKMGKPYYLKSNKINNIIVKRFKIKKYNLFLSISDEKDYSIAFTILQNRSC